MLTLVKFEIPYGIDFNAFGIFSVKTGSEFKPVKTIDTVDGKVMYFNLYDGLYMVYVEPKHPIDFDIVKKFLEKNFEFNDEWKKFAVIVNDGIFLKFKKEVVIINGKKENILTIHKLYNPIGILNKYSNKKS